MIKQVDCLTMTYMAQMGPKDVSELRSRRGDELIVCCLRSSAYLLALAFLPFLRALSSIRHLSQVGVV